MEYNINKLRLLLTHNPSESECVHALVIIRKELEILRETDPNSYSSFNFLKLFCDWALHMEIDRSLAGSYLLADINKTLNDVKDIKTDEVIKQISSSLIGKFRHQTRDFLIKNSLPIDIVNGHDEWRNFLKNILEIISHSTVLLKPNHNPDLASFSLKNEMWTRAVSIVKINFDTLTHEISTSDKGTYCLMVFTSDSTKIVVPITPAI